LGRSRPQALLLLSITPPSSLPSSRGVATVRGKLATNGESITPRGDKSKYSDKQKRKAEHIEESYEKRGVPEKEAASRAWATVNKESGGGNESGSGKGKPDTHVSSKKGGKKGGAASSSRTAEERSASAKKAAATRKRNKAKAGG
jgi:plasmid stabilization system protein ParE